MVLTVLKVIWTTLTKIPWQVWACSGAIFAAWLYGNYREQQVQQEWAASVERGKTVIEDLNKRANAVVTVVETKYQTVVEVRKEKADVIEKEIPVFIPSYNELLPGGFRLLHDASATSRLPSQADLPTALPVSIGDVTSTVNRNYTTCYQWKAELDGWNEWYEEQAKLWKELQARH